MLSEFYKNVHVKKNLKNAYVRNELDGNTIIIQDGCSINETLILNKIGQEILEIIKDECTLGQIINELSSRYQDIPMDIIERDVFNYVGTLYKLDLVNIKEANIMYSGNVLLDNSEYELFRCAEGDFKVINELLNVKKMQAIMEIRNVGEIADSYVPINLRAKLFNYAEDFYIIRRDSEVYVMFSIINGRNNIIKTSAIGILKKYKELPQEILTSFLVAAFKNHRNNYNPYSSKIRLSTTLSDLNAVEGLSSFIESMNFKCVAILKDEIEKGNDLYLYDYRLD